MDFKQSFTLAIKSLLASKMRSFLTMLGIIIGVASVIILVSVVEGMTNEIKETFEGMGTNLITASVRGRGSSRAISPDDMINLAMENSDVLSGCSPSSQTSQILSTLLYDNLRNDCRVKSHRSGPFPSIKMLPFFPANFEF